ncbi:Kinesin-like protein kip2 [Glugoides intestinalis]
MAMAKRIQIHLRIRDAESSIWEVNDKNLYYIKNKNRVTIESFESVFYRQKTDEIYKKTVQASIYKFKEGENVTIFAYGQTGSGKTHTIVGGVEDGFIKLALADVFPATLEISFFELFNEKLFDLCTGNELKMYSKNDRTIVQGGYKEKVTVQKDAFQFIEKCLENRKKGSTGFNISSSRSHAILQIRKDGAILTLIDLAGSERASYDDARMKEAAFINKSLLALGKLVNNLLNNTVLGFRESKLTRLLQETILSKTNMLAFCMINPIKECLSESLSTLNFAARISNVDFKQLERQEIQEPEKNNSEKSTNPGDNQKIKETLAFIQKLKESLSCIEQAHERIICVQKMRERLIYIQKERIGELEDTIVSLLAEAPDKAISELFVLEKQMYQITIEDILQTQESVYKNEKGGSFCNEEK